MKITRTAALIVVLLVSSTSASYASAFEPVSHEEKYQMMRSVMGTEPMPGLYKVIEKDLRAYRANREKYWDINKTVYEKAQSIPERKYLTQQDLVKIATEFDTYLRQLNFSYDQKLQNLKNMKSTPRGKDLWGGLAEDYPAFNDENVAQYQEREHKALLVILTATRDLYKGLSTQKQAYTSADGQLFFESPAQRFLYWQYLKAIRVGFQESIKATQDEFSVLESEPKAEMTYGKDYMASVKDGIAKGKKIIDNWARTGPRPAGEVTISQFFVKLEEAKKTNQNIIKLKNDVKNAEAQSKYSDAFRAEDVSSIASIDNVLTGLKKNITAINSESKAIYDLSIKLADEVPQDYNIVLDVINSSDAEFNAYYPDEISSSYTHGLMEYQQKVLTTAQACLKVQGKKKCTIKVIDGITLQVSDKIMQKSLDTAKADFIKVYGVEYEKRRTKALPPVGSKPANT